MAMGSGGPSRNGKIGGQESGPIAKIGALGMCGANLPLLIRSPSLP